VHFDPPLAETQRRAWSEEPEHRWPTAELPQRCNDYIARYFQNVGAYCAVARASTNEIEVRLGADHPLLRGIRLIGLTSAAFEAVRDAVINDPSTDERWADLLEKNVVREFEPVRIHSEIETLIGSGALQ
jgi:hypothetical protein